MRGARFASLLLIASSSFVYGQSTTTAIEEILKELQQIRETQKAIQKELQEIRNTLSQQRPVADALPKVPIDVSREPSRGDRAATVALIEYSDYQCPFCSRFGKEAYPQLEAEYIRTGKLRYFFRDLPLDFHKQAFKAAEAAHCAGEQGRFWEMHDRLFAHQKQLTPEELPKHAQALELNASAFQQCLESGRFAAEIRKDIADANSAGITGTPTFLLGTISSDGMVKVTKKIVGAQPYAAFKTAVDALLTPAR